MTDYVYLYGVCDFFTAEAECDSPGIRECGLAEALEMLASPQCEMVSLTQTDEQVDKLAREQFEELRELYAEDSDQLGLFPVTFDDLRVTISAKTTPKGMMDQNPTMVAEVTVYDYRFPNEPDNCPSFSIVIQKRPVT